MQKIAVITGSAGLIGSECVKFFIEKDYDVIGIDNDMRSYFFGESASTSKTNESLQKKYNRYEHHNADIRDYDKLKKIFQANYNIKIIIHTAAQPSHDWAAKEPLTDFSVNAMGTMNLLELYREYCPEASFIFTSCHDSETKLVTKNGIKPYKEIDINDTVFTINTDTNAIEENKINDIIISKYCGKMISVDGRSISKLVTPNHRMLLKNNSNDELFYERADTAKDRSICYIPIPNKWVGERKNTEYSCIDNDKKIKWTDLFFLYGLFIADGTTNLQIKTTENKSGLNKQDYVKINREKNSESFISKRNGNETEVVSNSYNVWFFVPKKDKARTKLERILNDADIKFHSYKNGDDTEGIIHFSSKILHEMFLECGKGAFNKVIPRHLLNFDKEYLLELFEGILLGDGNKFSTSLTTISKTLSEQMIELAYKIGKTCNIKSYSPTNGFLKNGRIIKGNYETYRISFSSKRKALSLTNNNFSEIDYNGDVWCLNTNNSNFLVYRNGKTFFSGNSNKVYGDRPNYLKISELENRYECFNEDGSLGSINETMSIDNCTHSVFGASKVAADIMVQEYGKYFNLNTVAFRGGCLTGPNHMGTELHGFLSYLIKCIIHDKPYTIFGYNGKQVRDNIHSWDLVNMFWHYHQNPTKGEVYNAGGGRDNCISIIEAIKKVNSYANTGWNNYTLKEDNRVGDHIWYISDLSKFKSHYKDWNIKYSLDKIIEDMVDSQLLLR